MFPISFTQTLFVLHYLQILESIQYKSSLVTAGLVRPFKFREETEFPGKDPALPPPAPRWATP